MEKEALLWFHLWLHKIVRQSQLQFYGTQVIIIRLYRYYPQICNSLHPFYIFKRDASLAPDWLFCHKQLENCFETLDKKQYRIDIPVRRETKTLSLQSPWLSAWKHLLSSSSCRRNFRSWSH